MTTLTCYNCKTLSISSTGSHNQISGDGNGVMMTYPNGSIVNVGSIFNSANDQNGQVIGGGTLLQTLQLLTLKISPLEVK